MSLNSEGIESEFCDTSVEQGVVYETCFTNQAAQTSTNGDQSSSHHGGPSPPPSATPGAQDSTKTSTFPTTADASDEISTHIPSSSQPIQITTNVSTATVTIASESLNPPLTVIQTSTSTAVESTQRHGAVLSVGATAGIIVAVLVLALLVPAAFWWRRRRHMALSHNLDFPGGSRISTPSAIPSEALSDADRMGSKRAVNRSGMLAGDSLGSVASSPSLLVYLRRHWRSRLTHLPPLNDDDPFASTPARPQISASDLAVMSERKYSTPSPIALSAQALSATTSAGLVHHHEGEAMPVLRPELTSSARTDSAPCALPTLDGTSASRSPSRAPTKTWLGESSARSAMPADALLPQLGHDGSTDTLCRGRTAVDGGVRLAGGPLDEAVDDTDDSETLPPPYQRY